MPKRKKQKYPPNAAVEHEGKPVHIKQPIKARNFGQELYLESLRNMSLTICGGPAGAGKTFLVTAVALEKLLSREVNRIVVTRPVVQAGEDLGFLPGTLEEKLDPYLLPLFDALQDHVGPMKAKLLLEDQKIEIAPLAYMRGRTFNNAFVILDEAQNTTIEQMRMFLTRIGHGSTFSINGDVTQSDLKKPRDHVGPWENGLQYAIRKLTGRDEQINYIAFENQDVVRSEIVKKILTLLDAPDPKKGSV